MYITDTPYSLYAAAQIRLHFEPLSQLRTGSPFWSGDDRSMTSVDPAIFNPDAEEEKRERGREGGRRKGSVTSLEAALPSTHSSLLLTQRMKREGGDRLYACASAPRGFEQGRREERVIGSRFYTIYRD